MSWFPGITTPAAAWLFALLVPLVLFYFLKLKRPRVEIPSLALWQSVIEDQRVNSPFQRFRKNLLLLLQVIVLSLLAFAAMQPFMRGSTERATYLPILIDCSASMGAMTGDGRTRLDLVKAEVGNLIRNLLSGQRITLIAVTDTARRLTEFTDNRRLLAEALDQLEVDDVPSQPEEGLQLAQALARTFEIPTVRFYTDGNLPTRPDPNGKPVAVVDFELPFQLDLHRVAGPASNLGITAINARRSGEDHWDVFVRIECSAAAKMTAEVELRTGTGLGGTPQDPEASEVISLEPGQSQRLVFHYQTAEATSLMVRLEPDGVDALEADNVAYLDLPESRRLRVYCPPELSAYRHALGVLPELELFPGEAAGDTEGAYDLVVSDAVADAALETRTLFLTGVVPSDLQGLVTVQTGLASVVDWQRDTPLLSHVQMRDLEITDQPMRGQTVRDADIEERGFHILATGETGPLIVAHVDAARQSFYVLFHTDRSTLPYRVGFPVLVSNLVGMAREGANLAEVRGTSTGVLPPFEMTANRTYQLTGPRGSEATLHSQAEGLVSGARVQSVGTYELREAGRPVRQFGVSLQNATETSLAGVDEIHFGELTVQMEGADGQLDRPLWRWLAAGALCVLLLEWWLTQRRPGGAV
jgi:hypothetical protein